MKYRDIGRTGIKASPLGFGCMRLPLINGAYDAIDEERSIKMIRYAIDQGVNYFDTAWPYHAVGHGVGGASEPLLAKALKDGYRDNVYIATKLPSWLIKSREDMDRFLDAQLKRLETDRIDFYLLHALNASSWDNLVKNRVVDFIEDARAEGKISYIGFSFHDELDVFKRITDAYDWDFCQIQYNYIDQDHQAGSEGLKYAAAKGMGVIAMEPLRGGNLATLPQEALKEIKKNREDWTSVDLAFNWLWSQKEVSVVLSGMSDINQVSENIKIADQSTSVAFDEKDSLVIDSVITVLNSKPQIGCTSCRYCMPCPVGVDIPRNFSLYNDHTIYGNPNSQYNYNVLFPEKERAISCIECGKCEELCPQHLQVRNLLKQVHKRMAL